LFAEELLRPLSEVKGGEEQGAKVASGSSEPEGASSPTTSAQQTTAQGTGTQATAAHDGAPSQTGPSVAGAPLASETQGPAVSHPVLTPAALPDAQGASSGWIRPTAIGAGAVGVVALVSGFLVGRSASSSWSDTLANSGTPLFEGDRARLLDAHDRYESRVHLGNALEIGGGVALAAGAALFTYDLLRAKPSAPTVAVGASPRGVWVVGQFE
jgi:hypothetical protein